MNEPPWEEGQHSNVRWRGDSKIESTRSGKVKFSWNFARSVCCMVNIFKCMKIFLQYLLPWQIFIFHKANCIPTLICNSLEMNEPPPWGEGQHSNVRRRGDSKIESTRSRKVRFSWNFARSICCMVNIFKCMESFLQYLLLWQTFIFQKANCNLQPWSATHRKWMSPPGRRGSTRM